MNWPSNRSDLVPDDPLRSTITITQVGPVRLSEQAIQQRMDTLPTEWKTDGESLFYEHTFADFVAAINFVSALVEPAETLGHHPDIIINYNRITLILTTHDAGGLTDLDFQLAALISQQVTTAVETSP